MKEAIQPSQGNSCCGLNLGSQCTNLIRPTIPQRHSQKQFLFEATWTRHEKCQEIIQEAWKSQLGVHSPIELIGGLKECADNLTKWSQNDLGFYSKKIQGKRKLLQEAVQAVRDRSKAEEIDSLRREINELLDEEEIRWNQRSRVDWLKLGDRNTQGCGTKMGSGVKTWGR